MKTLLLNGSKVLVVVAALGFLTVTLVSIAPPARADQWVAGCNAFWYPSTYTRGNCVRATTGTKNYTNHTQWVGWVETYKQGQDLGMVKKIEVWGDGFYFAQNVWTDSPYARWGAQRWVRSGTYVCGALTYEDNYRPVACIAIRV